MYHIKLSLSKNRISTLYASFTVPKNWTNRNSEDYKVAVAQTRFPTQQPKQWPVTAHSSSVIADVSSLWFTHNTSMLGFVQHLFANRPESQKNLWVANCNWVKIYLWSGANTAEISLKYLTCCNKLRATISNEQLHLLQLTVRDVFVNTSRCCVSCKISSGIVWPCQFQLVNHLTVIKPYIVFLSNVKEASTLRPASESDLVPP